MKRLAPFLLCLLMCWGFRSAQAESLAVRYQLDTRGHNTLGLWFSREVPFKFLHNGQVVRIPSGLSVWGFTDVSASQNGSRWDIDRSFSEWRPRYDGWSRLRIETELNLFTAGGTDVVRAGGALPLDRFVSFLPMAFWVRAFPLQTNGGQQLSLEWEWPLLPRLSLVGFFDTDFCGGADIVTEPAVIVTVTERLSLIAEGHYNSFEERIPRLSGFGMSGGIVFNF